VGGDRHVPCLSRGASGRGLDLGWWDDDWVGDYRFLAVRNLSSDPVKLGTSALGHSALCPHCNKIVTVTFT